MTNSLSIVGFSSSSLSQEIAGKLKELQPAGIILYDCNIETRQQVQQLIVELKDLLGKDLIVSIDQEGGKVERLRKVCSSFPSLAALGKCKDPKSAAQATASLAQEMKDLGFTLNFAPCADLATNYQNPIIGSRSLGSNPKQVSEQLKILINSFHQNGIMTCAKHFPGHGDTSLDSHLDSPISKWNSEEYKKHLLPFQASIQAQVPSIMMSHVIYPHLDEKPASLSSKIIQAELRQRLGFQGLIISDELTMKAVSKLARPGEIACQMLKAGCNLLVWNSNLDDAIEAEAEIQSQSRKDPELKQAIEDSKVRLSFFQKQQREFITHPITQISSKTTEEIMLKICKEAIKIKNSQTVLNFRNSIKSTKQKISLLYLDHPKLELEYIKQVFPGINYQTLSKTGNEHLEQFLKDSSNLVILSFQAYNNPEIQTLINKIKSRPNLQVIQCSTDMPELDSEIDLYGSNRIHLLALRSFLLD